MTEPFDLCGPLPTGITVLEASAGTGKTYTIAGLAARYVAEGTPLDKLLLVTFTRMATGELRERVRERLVAVEQGLEHPDGEHPDEVVRLLATGTDAEVATRRRRLARALADFDAATIETTHGFCQEVLGGLGTAGDVPPDGTFVEDITDLREEVVDDLYVRKFHRGDGPPEIKRAEAGRIGEEAIRNPTAPIIPTGLTDDGRPATRGRLAEAVRSELGRRKAHLALMTYDDLLTRLRGALRGPNGPAVAARLRARFDVVLVDEFQDTDPVQWEIVRLAFGDGGPTLVLIGDPKQAIYAFRGADVYAYLKAKELAGTLETLDVNRRSDQGLIDAYDAVFGGAQLGHEGIVYRKVRAAPDHQASRLRDAPNGAPLRVRVVHRGDGQMTLTANGFAQIDSARAVVARDLAADVVDLLSSKATVEGEKLRPGHVAVLVRRNRDAALVRDELDTAGVPAVINGAGSVFGTDPALEWLRLLAALERPAHLSRARAATLTSFVGWRGEQVAAASEHDWEDVHQKLHDWARVLRVKGVAALAETITLAERLPGRVLADPEGERNLTDLRHVAQLLHHAATTEHMGTTALTAWLRRRIAEAGRDTGDEERSRRLESDRAAVQVLTIHRSKGLEFPIVYYPYLWAGQRPPGQPVPVVFHDPDNDDERTIDVSLEGWEYRQHKQLELQEDRGEDLRLAYVALTRAKHQAVVWWAGAKDTRASSLGRLLFGRGEDGQVAIETSATPPDAAVEAKLRDLAEGARDCISVERVRIAGLPAHWGEPATAPPELAAASFDRTLDWGWRRTSYSDITAGAHEARVTSEPEEEVVADEPATESAPLVDDAGDEALRAVPSLLADMPVGLDVGTFVHRVFEHADFAAPDLEGELAAVIADAQARRRLDLGDTAAAGLRAVIETPLGPLVGGARLRDVTAADRLDELTFELPLVGGDEPDGWLAVSAIGDALRAHLPAGDPLAGYVERLADPTLRRAVRGYLTGSIDCVLRVDGRFAIVDYKTNWLGAPDEPLSAWHHRPAALVAEMEERHYALQALLYSAALHRYLHWRLPDYDPDRHLAGVLYLFVRGMIGAGTPVVDGTPCGVFAWRPPTGLIGALSDVLDAGS